MPETTDEPFLVSFPTPNTIIREKQTVWDHLFHIVADIYIYVYILNIYIDLKNDFGVI